MVLSAARSTEGKEEEEDKRADVAGSIAADVAEDATADEAGVAAADVAAVSAAATLEPLKFRVTCHRVCEKMRRHGFTSPEAAGMRWV